MNTPRPCEFYEERLTSYLLGDLPEAEAADVRHHLESCRLCRTSARELAVTLDLLRGALAETASSSSPALSPDRRRRVLARPEEGPAVVSLWKRYGHVIQWAAAVLVMAVTLGLLLPSLGARKFGLAMTGDADDRNGRDKPQWESESAAPESSAPAATAEPVSGGSRSYLSKSGSGSLRREDLAGAGGKPDNTWDDYSERDEQTAQAGERFSRTTATEGEKDLGFKYRENTVAETPPSSQAPQPAAPRPPAAIAATPTGSTENLRRSGATQVSAGTLVVNMSEAAPPPKSEPEPAPPPASTPAPDASAAAPVSVIAKGLAAPARPVIVSGSGVLTATPATEPVDSSAQNLGALDGRLSLESLKEAKHGADPAATAMPPGLPAPATPAANTRWAMNGSGPAPVGQPVPELTTVAAVDEKGQSTRLKKLETPLPKPMFVGTPVPVKLPNLEPAKPIAGPGGWAGQQDLSGFQVPGESRDKVVGQKAKAGYEVADGSLTLNGSSTYSGGTSLGHGTAGAEPARKLSETAGGTGGGGGIAGNGRMDYGLVAADGGGVANNPMPEDAAKVTTDFNFAKEPSAPGGAPQPPAKADQMVRGRQVAADTDGDSLQVLGDIPVVGKLYTESTSRRSDVDGKEVFKREADGRRAEESETLKNRLVAVDRLAQVDRDRELSHEESKKLNEDQRVTVVSDREKLADLNKKDAPPVALYAIVTDPQGPPSADEMRILSKLENKELAGAEVDQPVSLTVSGIAVATEPALERPIFKPAGFNPYVETATNNFSTFSIDVDTASFAMARRSINEGRRPEPESVRTEEFVNAFDYDYAPPAGGLFAVHAEMAPSPFRRPFELLKVGVKAKQIGRDQQRSSALTLVVDTSGSMNTPDRLGRIKETLKLLLERLDPSDSVALVQFDTKARLVLEHTPVSEKAKLLEAFDGLVTSGSTQLEDGLKLGYEVAAKGFRGGASNRVLLLSDGVANLGAGEAEGILQSVATFRRKGVYLSVFGFGTGTYNDAMLEALADKGDGQYVFIDSLDEAKRVIVENLAATLHVVAKDAKIQVEFNPKRVKRFRQVGYENRALEKEQFRDDTVDAGEVGSGQSVTALYEVELQGPAGEPVGTVRVRAQNPENGEVEEIARRIGDDGRHRSFESAPARFRLAAGVAEFAEQLRLSPYTAGTEAQETASALRPVALELNLDAHVQELVRLVQATESLPVK